MKNISMLFDYCYKLKTIKGLNKFITNKVCSMHKMFESCTEIETLDLSNFNTSNVTDMSFMFTKCYKLREIKGLNKFNTSNDKNMSFMFYFCSNLVSLDLSNFNTSNVTDTTCMI